MQLTWVDNSTGETAVIVERADDKRDAFHIVAQLPADTTIFAQTLSAGSYRYRVQAFSSTTGQSSAYSNVVQVHVK